MVQGTVQLGTKAYSGPSHSRGLLAPLVAMVLETQCSGGKLTLVGDETQPRSFTRRQTFMRFAFSCSSNANSLRLILSLSFLG